MSTGTIRVGAMNATICIYCKAELSDTTRWAHVWPASMGGRLKSRSICCDDCNNAIGVSEDKLRASLSHSFASVGATDDRRKPIEVTIQFEGRDFVLAAGNAIMKVDGRRFDTASKQIIVPLPAGFDNQVEVMAKALHSHGLGPDAAGTLGLAPGDPDPILPVGPTPNEHDLKIGRPIEHKRVFVKMGLELLAYHRHDLAMRGELSEARRFARHSSGTFPGKPDTRSAGSGLLDGLARPEVFNAIEVWSSGQSTFFRITFLGPIVFTGILTAQWGGDPFRAVYAFDARSPANCIASRIEDGDGPNLAVWFDGMIEESVEKAVNEIEAISQRLAESATIPSRDPSPDLEKLRAGVARRLAEMEPKRRKQRK